MAEIGSTLREARIRNKIDIGAVEQATKIRAKYLRALETEEFEVLPGPTYVKTFLRTYAEFLGLDPHLLVEEYRSRYEEYEERDYRPLQPPPVGRRRARPPRQPSKGLLVGAVILGVVIFLVALGLLTNDEEKPLNERGVVTTAKKAAGKKREGKETVKPASGLTAVTLSARESVWACLVDSKGKALVAARTLKAGASAGPFKSKQFRATFGNGSVDIVIDGRKFKAKPSPNPVGYMITAKGLTELPENKRPACS